MVSTVEFKRGYEVARENARKATCEKEKLKWDREAITWLTKWAHSRHG